MYSPYFCVKVSYRFHLAPVTCYRSASVNFKHALSESLVNSKCLIWNEIFPVNLHVTRQSVINITRQYRPGLPPHPHSYHGRPHRGGPEREGYPGQEWSIFTDHVRSARGGNVFRCVCPFVHRGGGICPVWGTLTR